MQLIEHKGVNLCTSTNFCIPTNHPYKPYLYLSSSFNPSLLLLPHLPLVSALLLPPAFSVS